MSIARRLPLFLALATILSMPVTMPQRAAAAPSLLQTIQTIVRTAIAAAPTNFAGIRDEGSADPTGFTDEISRDYRVSAATQGICTGCDMGITYWDAESATRTGAAAPAYWEFSLSVSIGTLERADVPKFLRTSLGPAIPKSFSYAGTFSTGTDAQLQDDEIRWNGLNGLMIRVKSSLSGYGPNKRVAVIYVRHTP